VGSDARAVARSADKRLAVEVEDHPLDYGDFEGTIPENQYGGGTVQLWPRLLGIDDADRGFRKGDLKFTLRGEKLHGSWVLVRMKGDRFGGKRTNWLLIKHRDEFVKQGEDNDILEEDRSVASGRSMDQIAAGQGQGAQSRSCSHEAETARRKPMRSGTPTAETQRRRAPGQGGRFACRAGQAENRVGYAGFRRAAALRIRRNPPTGEGGATRSSSTATRAVARRGRRGRAKNPQGAGLDRQVPAIAREGDALPDALIDGEIVAVITRAFGFFRAAGRNARARPAISFLRVRSVVRRREIFVASLSERKAR